jgi:hypothetical protein
MISNKQRVRYSDERLSGCGDLQGWFKDSVIHPKSPTGPVEAR